MREIWRGNERSQERLRMRSLGARGGCCPVLLDTARPALGDAYEAWYAPAGLSTAREIGRKDILRVDTGIQARPQPKKERPVKKSGTEPRTAGARARNVG